MDSFIRIKMFSEHSKFEIGLRATLTVVSIIAATAGLWPLFASSTAPTIWFIVLLLTIFATIAILYYVASRIEYIGYNSKDPNRLDRKAAQMLDHAKESLYYVGGVGLVNSTKNDAFWQIALSKKMDSGTFRFERIADFIDGADFENLHRGQSLTSQLAWLNEYRGWLEWHVINISKFEGNSKSDPVAKANSNYNLLRNFRGSPLFKIGLHVLIFDSKHIVLSYRKDSYVRGVIVRHASRVASDIVSVIKDNMIAEFRPAELHSHSLRKIIDSIDAKIVDIKNLQAAIPGGGAP